MRRGGSGADIGTRNCSMTRRSSPKDVKPNADSERESVKFGRARAPKCPDETSEESARMSTKTPKRKKAAAAVTEAVEMPAPAPVASEPAAVVSDPVDAAPAEVAAAPAESQRSEPIVSLFSSSTVKDAAALRDTLLQLIDEPRPVAIDAKSVERIDTAIIQVLCAFISDRAERCLAVAWRSPPQPLYEAARLLGVGALLALPTQPAEA